MANNVNYKATVINCGCDRDWNLHCYVSSEIVVL